MRISDWSSDVCSSDLGGARRNGGDGRLHGAACLVIPSRAGQDIVPVMFLQSPPSMIRKINELWRMRRVGPRNWSGVTGETKGIKIGRAPCRERGCKYV